jgi:hypothetical protein
MLNVAVAEIGLQGASVVALVGQGITASVPKHMRVRLEFQLGLPARPFDQAGEASRAERCPSFRGETAYKPMGSIAPQSTAPTKRSRKRSAAASPGSGSAKIGNRYAAADSLWQ